MAEINLQCRFEPDGSKCRQGDFLSSHPQIIEEQGPGTLYSFSASFPIIPSRSKGSQIGDGGRDRCQQGV